jgi:hypothetical protein
MAFWWVILITVFANLITVFANDSDHHFCKFDHRFCKSVTGNPTIYPQIDQTSKLRKTWETPGGVPTYRRAFYVGSVG